MMLHHRLWSIAAFLDHDKVSGSKYRVARNATSGQNTGLVVLRSAVVLITNKFRRTGAWLLKASHVYERITQPGLE